MKQATIAEVQVALQSLLAHFEPPDDYLTHYTRDIWRELKARINIRKNHQKRKKFKEMIREAFEMYRARRQNNNQHVTKHYKHATSKVSRAKTRFWKKFSKPLQSFKKYITILTLISMLDFTSLLEAM